MSLRARILKTVKKTVFNNKFDVATDHGLMIHDRRQELYVSHRRQPAAVTYCEPVVELQYFDISDQPAFR